MKNPSETSNQKPKNWPAGIGYLTRPSYSAQLSDHQIQALKTRGTNNNNNSSSNYHVIAHDAEIPANLPKGPSPLAKIIPITEPHHPAHGQAGLFATRRLAPGSLILPYYGVVHPHDAAAHAGSDYDLWLDRDAGVSVDAAKWGNEARFVNDYRGVRERPNAEFRECWDARTGEKTMAVFVLPASKKKQQQQQKNKQSKAAATYDGIAKGQEICVSYGKGFWGKRAEEEEVGGGKG